VKTRVLVSIGAAVGAGLLLRRWRHKRRTLREAQARGDRAEVVARLRLLSEEQRSIDDTAAAPASENS
jgi:hypothetical protein